VDSLLSSDKSTGNNSQSDIDALFA